jgi:hypothetical protein
MAYFWRDNPNLTPEECEANYRAGHMLLAREMWRDVDGFIALVYNRVRQHSVNDYNNPERRPADPPFHAFVEMYFESREKLDAAAKLPGFLHLFDDHETFMDITTPANIAVFELEEDVFAGKRP